MQKYGSYLVTFYKLNIKAQHFQSIGLCTYDPPPLAPSTSSVSTSLATEHTLFSVAVSTFGCANCWNMLSVNGCLNMKVNKFGWTSVAVKLATANPMMFVLKMEQHSWQIPILACALAHIYIVLFLSLSLFILLYGIYLPLMPISNSLWNRFLCLHVTVDTQTHGGKSQHSFQ